MNKTIRIVLYVLSILTVAGVIAAAILTGGQAKPASAPGATAEEEQAEMSDAEATLDGEATADGSGISTDGAETAGEDGSMSENAVTAGENGSISDDAATAGETANQSDDTTTAAGTGSASDETANKDNQKDSGDTTIILTGDVLFANAFKAAYDAGGMTIGVVPSKIEENGHVSQYLSVEIPCDNLSDRKDLMLLKSDVVVALPGGLGTLDEIFTVAASSTIGYHNKRVILYNINGFWNTLIALLDDLQQRGMIRGDYHRHIEIADSFEQLKQLLARQELLNHQMAALCRDILDETSQTPDSLPNYSCRVPDHWLDSGVTIGALRFWQATGATIVAIRRNLSYIVSPGPYAELYAGDTVIFVGDTKAREAVSHFFSNA